MKCSRPVCFHTGTGYALTFLQTSVMRKFFTSLALALLCVHALPAQDAKCYFVDGFHGGYYGRAGFPSMQPE